MTVHQKIRFAERIAIFLDSAIVLGPIKFGFDPIIGLIPGLGDVISFAISAYLIMIAIQHKASVATISKMIFYAGADFLIGTVPLIGDFADFFFKGATKNIELLKDEFGIIRREL